jgi:hypothetical protein
MWPDTLPGPQADGFTVESPPRVEVAGILFGTTRLAVKARTAPMTWTFTVWLTTPLEMEIFEGFYRDSIENHDGEFYARWIGGSRVVAFIEAYEYAPIGVGWSLTCKVVRTRIDGTACDEFLGEIFGAIYRADLTAPDHYEADLTAADIYVDDFDLSLIAANEC